MHYSRHRRAVWFLSAISFAESSFFPVPPDVMLAPMCLGSPKKAWHYALITTLCSVAGGLLGYAIGFLAIDTIMPYLDTSSYHDTYLKAVSIFDEWGFWALFVAGFSPIPYKVFTIAGGAASMPLLPFVLASLIGRGARFFLVAGLMAWGGEKMENYLHRIVDRLGWVMVVVLTIAVLIKIYN